MGVVAKTSIVSASAEQVWKLVGDWNGLPKWHPWCLESHLKEAEGGVRRDLKLNFGEVVEDLVHFDAANRTYTYEIIQGPLPFSFYHGTLRVRGLDSKTSEVLFFVQFTPKGVSEEEGAKKIGDFISAGFEHLTKLYK